MCVCVYDVYVCLSMCVSVYLCMYLRMCVGMYVKSKERDDAIESDGSRGRLMLLWLVLAGREASLRGNAESEGSEEPARQ